MNTTTPPKAVPPSPVAPEVSPSSSSPSAKNRLPVPPSRPAKAGGWGLAMWLLLGVVAAAGVAYTTRVMLFTAKTMTHIANQPVAFTNTPWDGRVVVNQEAQAALALATVPVVAQTDPTRVPLLGTTRHDETMITKIRPLFKGRVDRVHIAVGDRVEVGVPLVDL